jgi:precorrin-6A/cobalt-precorrin-6A reductase
MNPRHPILILGGTTEARLLAGELARQPALAVTLSLAGRTAHPARQPVPVRSGGFGGAEGLADYLRRQSVELLVDATHPYAARISRHAELAAAAAGVPALALVRPPWPQTAGDRWRVVGDARQAVAALGEAPRRVFLALGRQEIEPFAAAPQHFYLIRSVDPVTPPLAVPQAVYRLDRGPFAAPDEQRLLAQNRIDAVVAKNSGGTATYAKIAAARALGIEVLLLERPAQSGLPTVPDVGTALDRIAHRFASAWKRGV